MYTMKKEVFTKKKKKRSGWEYNLLLVCLPSSYDPYQQTNLRKNKKNENGKLFLIFHYVTYKKECGYITNYFILINLMKKANHCATNL